MQGLPAGRCILTVLWCLVLDDVLAWHNGNGVFIQGYVDDICLLVLCNSQTRNQFTSTDGINKLGKFNY